MDTMKVLAIFLAPLAAVLIFGVFGQAIKLLIARHMPDGWLKRALLVERFESQYSAASGRILKECIAYTERKRRRVGGDS